MRTSPKKEKTFLKTRNPRAKKYTITELKNLTESLKSRINHGEERISGLKDRTFEIIHSEEQKERMKNREESLWNLWYTMKRNNICVIRIPEREK